MSIQSAKCLILVRVNGPTEAQSDRELICKTFFCVRVIKNTSVQMGEVMAFHFQYTACLAA